MHINFITPLRVVSYMMEKISFLLEQPTLQILAVVGQIVAPVATPLMMPQEK